MNFGFGNGSFISFFEEGFNGHIHFIQFCDGCENTLYKWGDTGFVISMKGQDGFSDKEIMVRHDHVYSIIVDGCLLLTFERCDNVGYNKFMESLSEYKCVDEM